jgi:hypothetical protein
LTNAWECDTMSEGHVGNRPVFYLHQPATHVAQNDRSVEMFRFIFRLIYPMYYTQAVRVQNQIHNGHFLFGRLVYINPKADRQL